MSGDGDGVTNLRDHDHPVFLSRADSDSDNRNDNNDIPVAREILGILQIDQKEQISEKKKKRADSVVGEFPVNWLVTVSQ